MTLAKNINARSLIAEIKANADAVVNGTLEPVKNNSANGSYRNIFATVRLVQAEEKLRMAKQRQTASLKIRARKKK